MAASLDGAIGTLGEKVSLRLVEYAQTPAFAGLMKRVDSEAPG